MRGGTSVNVSVTSSKFVGETLPRWISTIKGPPNNLDVSAVLHSDPDAKSRSLRLAVVNRSETQSYDVPLRLAFERAGTKAQVHELWHPDVKARNGWGQENEVAVKTRTEHWNGRWTFREHSVTLLVIQLE